MKRFTMGFHGAPSDQMARQTLRWFVKRDNADGRWDVVCDLLTEEQARACEIALNKLDERNRRRASPPTTAPRASRLRRGRIRGS